MKTNARSNPKVHQSAQRLKTPEFSSLSTGPSALNDLTAEQAERLSRVLDEFLASMERGESIEHDAILAKHPDLREPLEMYLSKLGELYNFSGGFAPLVDEDPLSDSSSQHSSSENTSSDTSSAYDANVGSSEPLPPSSSPSVPVRQLGDFTLLRVIGRGGMGVVYEAEQISLRRRVALKLLPLVSVLDTRQITRFKNEAQAAARLQHPHIVPVYAVGVARGVHFYAMQFIDGAPLDQIIQELDRQRDAVVEDNADRADAPTVGAFKDGAFSNGAQGAAIQEESLTEAVSSDEAKRLITEANLSSRARGRTQTDYHAAIRLGIEAASALAAAHEDGIVHRDIKPSNLLLDHDGKLWVTDFGLARQLSDKTITVSGDFLGTLRYMSPEQAAGESALVDARSDIYSLGVTLYELLTLQPAIVGENSPNLLKAIESREPQSLSQLRPDLPRDLVSVVEMAMSKSREDRYATARQFAQDLERVAEGRPTLAKPTTTMIRLAKWAMRHQRLVAAGVAIIAFCAMLLLISVVKISRAQIATQRSLDRVVDLQHKMQSMVMSLAILGPQELAGVAGTETYRRRQLLGALDSFRELIREVGDEPALQADVAFSHLCIADISEQLGDRENAQANYEQAFAAYSRLLDAFPRDARYQLAAARCESRFGTFLATAGGAEEAAEAEEKFLSAIRRARSIVKLPSEGNDTDLVLGEALNGLGQLWAKLGRYDQASEKYSEAVQTLEPLLIESPDDPAVGSLLAKVSSNRATLIAKNDTEAAKALYTRSIDLQQRVLKVQGNLPPTTMLAVTYNNLGATQRRAGEWSDASLSFSKSIAIGRQQVNAAPSNPTCARDLGLSLNNFGTTEDKLGRQAEAEKAYREAIGIYTKLQQSQKDDAGLASELAGTYNNLAMLLRSGGDIAAVDEAFERAISYQTRASELAPTLKPVRDALDNHLFSYAQWLRETKRFQKALEQSLVRRDQGAGDGDKILSVAKELASFAGRPALSNDEKQWAKKHAEAAFETLRLFRAQGFGLQSKELESPPLVWLSSFGLLPELVRP